MRVTDSANVSKIDTTLVRILNVPPTATLTGASVVLGNATSIAFSNATDPSAADVSSGFTYSFDFNNDGTFEVVDSTNPVATVPANFFTKAGIYTAKATIKDRDGGMSSYSTGVTVYTVASTLTGKVILDQNSNGQTDPGDTPIANQFVYIDWNGNNTFDGADVGTYTDSTGAYTFNNLPGGTQLPPGVNYVRQLLTFPRRQVVSGNPGSFVISSIGGTGTAATFYDNEYAPTANAGGPYTVAEGGMVTLTGTSNASAGNSGISYFWDLNYDGVKFNPSTTFASSADFSALLIDGPATRMVAFAARDGNGILSNIATTTINITDSAPTATMNSSGPVAAASPVTVSLADISDAGLADTSWGMRYSFATTQAGLATSWANASTTPSQNFTFANSGSYTVYARVFDKDNGYRDYNTLVTVNGSSTTPTDPSTVTLEAESASLAGGTATAHDNTGYTGTGYADFGGNGSSATFNLTRVAGGTESLVFRYANGSTVSRPMSITVDGIVIGSVACAPTGAWTKWSTVTINTNLLGAGPNTIKAAATTTNGGANVDSLTINTISAPALMTIQGETGTFAGGTKAAKDNGGYIGTGYADFGGKNSTASYTVNSTVGGNATLTLRYANGSTANRPLSVAVNGTVVTSPAFAPTGSWITWATITLSVRLLAGSNTIKFTVTGTDGPNLDWLSIG